MSAELTARERDEARKSAHVQDLARRAEAAEARVEHLEHVIYDAWKHLNANAYVTDNEGLAGTARAILLGNLGKRHTAA